MRESAGTVFGTRGHATDIRRRKSFSFVYEIIGLDEKSRCRLAVRSPGDIDSVLTRHRAEKPVAPLVGVRK